MSKIISAVVLLAMIAHIIRPFGLPGLRRRKDAWRLAVVAFGLILLTVWIKPEGG